MVATGRRKKSTMAAEENRKTIDSECEHESLPRKKKMMHKSIPKCHISCVTRRGANLPRSALDPPRDRCRSSSAGNLHRDPCRLTHQSRQQRRTPAQLPANPRMPRNRPWLEVAPRLLCPARRLTAGSPQVANAVRASPTSRIATSGGLTGN